MLVIILLISVTYAFPHFGVAPPHPPFNSWVPTNQSDLAPCPVLNSLINHGLMPREKITRNDLTHAMKDILLIDASSTKVFVDGALAIGYDDEEDGERKVDLEQIRIHNKLEHDVSMTRSDDALGDPIHLNVTLYNQLRSLSTNHYITLDALVQFRSLREQDSKARNPSLSYTRNQRFTANGEAAIIFLLLRADPQYPARDSRQKGIPLEWMDSLILQEKFPSELGWEPRPISFWEIMSLTNYFMWNVKGAAVKSDNALFVDQSRANANA
ncbi:hypothetical protein HDU97_003007 [Phlyctochytrium planicorne]|nr:hypothetical protein HDU97_003007 [Phlyctochytrium planicorne]